MKERPILFRAPMVRSVMDGSKTQTRRHVKFSDRLGRWDAEGFYQVQADTISKMPWSEHSIRWNIACPYGQPGDRLWVRETWWHDDEDNWIIYRADPDSDIVDVNKHETGFAKYNWRPSIFMPRAASRITLEITGVRVERLLSISEADAKAEGAQLSEGPCTEPEFQSYTLGYLNLWDSINGAESRNENPWVWVIEFKRVTL